MKFGFIVVATGLAKAALAVSQLASTEDLTAVNTVALAAGATITARIIMKVDHAGGVGTATLTWENAVLRLTAIKR